MRTRFLIGFLAIASAMVGQSRPGLPLPPSGSVTLPIDEYNRLIDLSNKVPKADDRPPIPYALNSADLKIAVNGSSATGTVLLDGTTFGKGLTKVPLATGMVILNAQQNGKELPLDQTLGVHSAVLQSPSEFTIGLDAGFAIAQSPGSASLQFLAPSAGIVRLTFSLPGENSEISVTPGVITRRSSGGGRITVEATLLRGQPTSIRWATREVPVPETPHEVRFLSDLKTLLSVRESQFEVAVLASISVVQGDPSQFEVSIPAGYEVTSATGSTLVTSQFHSGVLVLDVTPSASHTHQFLISLEKSLTEARVDAPFLSFKGSQRDTGEVLVEGAGAMELTATEGGGLKRMDFREASPSLHTLSHDTPEAAFRYHKQPDQALSLALSWVHFPDSPVLAAIAQRAVVTTLVTAEGKSLSEVKLLLRNEAQPFLKVSLPPGASILSAEVGGKEVKPVQAPDGNRVPLLRTGFRPNGLYEVSFVFLHSGAPFAKKGGSELTLPKMDLAINLIQWEVFLPSQFKVKEFDGDVTAARLMQPSTQDPTESEETDALLASGVAGEPGTSGTMEGVVTDPIGSVIANARVLVTGNTLAFRRTAVADTNGHWAIPYLPSGTYKVTIDAAGFNSFNQYVNFNSSQPTRLSSTLKVGSTMSQVEVMSAGARADTGEASGSVSNKDVENLKLEPTDTAASQNAINLQRRVAGVLPIRVDVPHTGTSYHFVRPLVIDEETKVTFTYKSK